MASTKPFDGLSGDRSPCCTEQEVPLRQRAVYSLRNLIICKRARDRGYRLAGLVSSVRAVQGIVAWSY